MTIKTILVPMTATASDRQALELALNVAKPSCAHIRALFARPDPKAVPVLLTPAQLPPDLFHSAIIAWNGSPEANHAVAAALPPLSRCARVSVFHEPDSKRDEVEPEELIDRLAWHGVAAEKVPANRGIAGGTGEQLLDAAGRLNASLLVMGAYTHGRLRQFVFGGVTHHVLHHATIPALLMH